MTKESKTIFNPRYRAFIKEMVVIRNKKGLTQRDLAAKSGKILNFIGRTETCQRRLDIVETVVLLKALGLSKSEISKLLQKYFY